MFWERFYNECKKNNISPNKLATEINIASGTVTKWKKGIIPNGETLILISDYLKVSIDYLLGKEKEVEAASPEEIKLLKNYRSSDQIGKDRICYTAETEAKRTEEQEKIQKSTA